MQQVLVKMIETPESSNIKAIGYLSQLKELFVRFKTGKVYAYYDVPATRFDDFRNAKSKGEFFSKQIKTIHITADMTGSQEVLFSDDEGYTIIPPRPPLCAVQDPRWNW